MTAIRVIDNHNELINIGSNSHAEIDIHIVDPNAHHSQNHTIASHDTDASGTELNELTDGSNTVLHSHAESPVLFPFELGENLIAGDPVYIYDDSGAAKIKKVYSALENIDTEFRGYYHHSCLVAPNIIVVVYRDFNVSNRMYVIAGEIQLDNSINWGTKQLVFASYAYYLHIDKVNTNKFVVIGRGTGAKTAAWIGEVDGSQNISLGSEYPVSSGGGYDQTCCYVSTDKFAISYRDAGLMNHGYTVIGTCVGTNVITLGTAVEHGITSSYENWVCVPDPATEKIAVFYRRTSGSTCAWCRCSTITDPRTIDGFDTEIKIGNYPYYSCAESIATDKCAYVYRDNSDGNKLKSIIVKFLGTGVIVNLADIIILDSSAVYYMTLCKLADNEFVVAWEHWVSPYEGRLCKCTVFDTAIIKESDQVYQSGYAYYNSLCRVTDTKYFLLWYSITDVVSNYIVVEGELNLLDYTTGILQETGSLGEIKNIDLLGGITSQLAGLIPGKHYYIQNDATIGITPTNYHIGIALSATSMLIIKGYE